MFLYKAKAIQIPPIPPNLKKDDSGATSKYFLDQLKGGYAPTLDFGKGNSDNTYYSIIFGQGHLIDSFGTSHLIMGGENCQILQDAYFQSTILNSADSFIHSGLLNVILGGEKHNVRADNSATVAGFQNIINALAYASVVMGAYNRCDNPYTLVQGYQCISTPSDTNNNGGNVLMGFRSKVTGFGSNVFGANNEVTGGFCTIVGQSAKLVANAPNNVNQANDLRFVVGNGNIVAQSFTNTSRSNALEVYQSGVVSAPTLTNALIDAGDGFVLTTKSYIQENYIKKPVGVYADNASAVTGGLVVDDTYRTADGTLKIVF